jgi:hypothetical protein
LELLFGCKEFGTIHSILNFDNTAGFLFFGGPFGVLGNTSVWHITGLLKASSKLSLTAPRPI